MEDTHIDTNIDKIYSGYPDIERSISGKNVMMRVLGQERVGNLWTRLTKEAGTKYTELEMVINQYDEETKTEKWTDHQIMTQLEQLAHLLGYLKYLIEEKWHSSKQAKAVAYKCMTATNDLVFKFEELLGTLNEKNENLGKQISETFSMGEDGEIF